MERATFAGIAVVIFVGGGNARFDKHGWRNIRVGLFYVCAQLHLCCHLVGKESAFSVSLSVFGARSSSCDKAFG